MIFLFTVAGGAYTASLDSFDIMDSLVNNFTLPNDENQTTGLFKNH